MSQARQWEASLGTNKSTSYSDAAVLPAPHKKVSLLTHIKVKH